MSISFIGSTLKVVASTPAAEDASSYGALSMITVGKVISIGEIGDTNEDIAFDRLADGRRVHVNGTKDMGDIPVVLDYDRDDAGLTIIEAGEGSNTTHSFLITDSDGDQYYFQGLIANFKSPAREANAYKSVNFVIRSQTGITTIDGS